MNSDPLMIQSNTKLLKDIAFDMTVLLVEDDIEIQHHLKNFLSRFFGRVDTATNGIEALDLYNLHLYDLVITDLTMPYMDGIEFSANIRNIKNSQHIIVVSAHSESEKLIKLINIGVEGFILKPVDIQQVITMLLKSCQSIYDHKMLHYFNNLLEQTNAELRESNMELESTLNKLGRLREEYHSLENSTSDLDDPMEDDLLKKIDEIELSLTR
ncbi:response regulator [Sulfuricurvum sp.]|uniref:response regulator transcription factor n=1 Tax=Sulfuricurvum sp. TaxID=2025608 RepID=UPI002E305795|nr:response regulator [Sulfuricurvum sp.]HEX5329776.1 response regulator [Sulfuricurvum sp.]